MLKGAKKKNVERFCEEINLRKLFLGCCYKSLINIVRKVAFVIVAMNDFTRLIVMTD